MARKINENQDHGGFAHVINLPAAAGATEPVRQAEFQAAIAGLDYIEAPARAAATINVAIGAPGAAIDGVTLATNDRVLLTAQTTPSQNGLYVFNGAAVPLTRTTDTYLAGSVVITGPDGTNNKNALWLQSTDSPVVGTTALTFTQFGTLVSAGTGLTLTGSVMALATPVSIATGGTGATSAGAARTALGAAGAYSANFGDGASSSFAITHNLNNQYCAVSVTNLSTGQDEECTVTRNSANQLTLTSEAWTASPPAAAAYRVSCVG